MDTPYFAKFEVREDSCISQGYGGLCLNAVSRVDCFAVSPPSGTVGGLQTRMPVEYEPGSFAFFQKSNSAREQDLILIPRNAGPLNATLEDTACNDDTCCGMQLAGDRFAVIYLQTSENRNGNQGLKFALWGAE